MELANKGFITQIEAVENLVALSEAELVDKGYITQTGVFDADETTEEEVPVVDEGDENDPIEPASVDDEPVEPTEPTDEEDEE